MHYSQLRVMIMSSLLIFRSFRCRTLRYHGKDENESMVYEWKRHETSFKIIYHFFLQHVHPHDILRSCTIWWQFECCACLLCAICYCTDAGIVALIDSKYRDGVEIICHLRMIELRWWKSKWNHCFRVQLTHGTVIKDNNNRGKNEGSEIKTRKNKTDNPTENRIRIAFS